MDEFDVQDELVENRVEHFARVFFEIEGDDRLENVELLFDEEILELLEICLDAEDLVEGREELALFVVHDVFEVQLPNLPVLGL